MSASAPVDTTEIGTYQRVAANKFRELTEILDGLPIEALTWKPFDQSPWHGAAGSLGWLIAHSASSTIYLLRRAEWILERRDWGRNFRPFGDRPGLARRTPSEPRMSIDASR